MVMCYRNTNIFSKITWQQIKCRKYIYKKYMYHSFVTRKFQSTVSPTGQKLTELNHGQLLSRFLLL